MRILFVTHNIPRHEGDAAGSFVLRLAVALQAAGHRVDVLAPGGPGLAATDRLEGVRIRRIPYAATARMTLAYTGTMAEEVRRSWAARWALVGLLRALRRGARSAARDALREGDPYAVVHAHWWFPAGLALWRARLAANPSLVVTMHGSDVRLAAATRPAHPLLRLVLRRAALCTVVSSWLGNTVTRIAPRAAVRLGPMPIDTRLFAADAEGAEVATPRRGLLFVGRLNAQKGLRDLLDALDQPATTLRPFETVHLDVIGDGPDRAALEAHAGYRALAHRVRWHGALPQAALAPFYRRAACVVIPSREEGLGLVAVEAQCAGTPVIAYDSGGLPDVVRPEDGGTLVPVGDITALSEAIAARLGDPAATRRLGHQAAAAMRRRFTPEAVAATYAAWYAEVARTQPPASEGQATGQGSARHHPPA